MKRSAAIVLLMVISACGGGCRKGTAPAVGLALASPAVVVEVKEDGFLYITAPPAMSQGEIDRIVETNAVYQSWMQSQMSNVATRTETIVLPTRIMISDGLSSHLLPDNSGIGMTLLDDRTEKGTANHASDGIRQPADGSPKPSR